MNTDDLPSWLKNHKTLTSPKININTRKTKDSENSTSTNIRPKYTDENSNGSGLTNNKGNGVMPWNKAESHNGLQKTDNNNNNKETTNNNNNIISNGTNHDSDNIKRIKQEYCIKNWWKTNTT